MVGIAAEQYMITDYAVALHLYPECQRRLHAPYPLTGLHSTCPPSPAAPSMLKPVDVAYVTQAAAQSSWTCIQHMANVTCMQHMANIEATIYDLPPKSHTPNLVHTGPKVTQVQF